MMSSALVSAYWLAVGLRSRMFTPAYVQDGAFKSLLAFWAGGHSLQSSIARYRSSTCSHHTWLFVGEVVGVHVLVGSR